MILFISEARGTFFYSAKNAFFNETLRRLCEIFDRHYNAKNRLVGAGQKTRSSSAQRSFRIGLSYQACHYSPLTGFISSLYRFSGWKIFKQKKFQREKSSPLKMKFKATLTKPPTKSHSKCRKNRISNHRPIAIAEEVSKRAHWAFEPWLRCPQADDIKAHHIRITKIANFILSFLRFSHPCSPPKGKNCISRKKCSHLANGAFFRTHQRVAKKRGCRKNGRDSNIANCTRHTHTHLNTHTQSDEYVNLCSDACATSSPPKPPHIFPARCMFLMCT